MRAVGILLQAIQELRGTHSVTDQNAEAKYQALDRYANNLNTLAKKGKIHPVIGRDEEIRRVLQIVSRRAKNNPLLLGAPGVGKAAIVEGLAQRIVECDVLLCGFKELITGYLMVYGQLCTLLSLIHI